MIFVCLFEFRPIKNSYMSSFLGEDVEFGNEFQKQNKVELPHNCWVRAFCKRGMGGPGSSTSLFSSFSSSLCTSESSFSSGRPHLPGSLP